MSPLASKAVNYLLYQIGWFSCILGASRGYPISGAFCALLMMIIHLLLAESRSAELRLMLYACLVGIVIDSVQQELGVFTFKMEPDWPLWLPLWVLIIWAQFATLFHYALYWLSGRYLLGAVFGLLGGPLAYWGGIRLGAAEFGDNLLFSMISLALVWSLITPLLLYLSGRVDAREGRYRGFRSRNSYR